MAKKNSGAYQSTTHWTTVGDESGSNNLHSRTFRSVISSTDVDELSSFMSNQLPGELCKQTNEVVLARYLNQLFLSS